MHPARPRNTWRAGTASLLHSAWRRRRDFLLMASRITHGFMRDYRRHQHEQRSDRRVTPRLSVRRARSWTGRSAVASATDSHLSRLATAGTRVTRVSAMRLLSARAERLAPQGATFSAGHAPLLRRMDPEPLITSG
jgi:hypothetical protein